jgi:hypothetical protein
MGARSCTRPADSDALPNCDHLSAKRNVRFNTLHPYPGALSYGELSGDLRPSASA